MKTIQNKKVNWITITYIQSKYGTNNKGKKHGTWRCAGKSTAYKQQKARKG
jgi:hypothetical protein